MKIGKVLARLASNPRVANLVSDETAGTVTVTLKSGFINGGKSEATLKNAHAARLFIRDAIGPDGRAARPGRPAKVPAVAIELPVGFVTRATDAGVKLGTIVKQNSKAATIAANGSQVDALRRFATKTANDESANIGVRQSAKSVLAKLPA